VAERGDVFVRSAVWLSVLDGSHFHRLMQTGGRFEEALEVTAPSTFFGGLLIFSLAAMVARLVARRRSGAWTDEDRTLATLLLAAGLLTLGMLALPGAVRAHHQLNVFPLLQIVAAAGALCAWHAPLAATKQRVLRASVALLLLLTVGSQIRVIALTQQAIDATGGKGRWTHALHDLAAEIDVPETVVVSLDWGFHEPLQLLTDHAELHEAIWVIPRVLRSGRPWIVEGDANTVYLAHDAPYDLFGLGPLFLSTMRAQDAGSVQIVAHRDGSGDVAFYSVRVPRPHRLDYTGEFHLLR
jgi:hypothetical protein